jgi:hypothetical protein
MISSVLVMRHRPGWASPSRIERFSTSAEVDDYLLPIVVRMWPGNEVATAQDLRRDFKERYGDLSSRVLAFCLRTFQHGNIEGLKRAAGVA